ncbi:FadR/GntR family transcriptional regulator [Luteococcus peritonei]|uniref:FadR/GntR family transcriptional regulator n=1 Tax=Luteococcus peritonei TaxID=88874 RepID=A0ABW4RYV6_9ACTN
MPAERKPSPSGGFEMALERAAAASAVRHRHLESLEQARALQASMEQAVAPGQSNRLDTYFHMAIARAGDNILLSDLAVAIRRAVHSPIQRAEQALGDWTDFEQGLAEQHGAVLEAVLAGDEQAAADLVEHHIRHAYRHLLPRCG